MPGQGHSQAWALGGFLATGDPWLLEIVESVVDETKKRHSKHVYRAAHANSNGWFD